MLNRILPAAVIAVSWLALQPVAAHHSNSAFDVEKIVEIKGTVKEFRWANPHTFILLTGVDDGQGGKVDWTAEGRPPGVLGRAGWSKTSLKAGDTITVHCSPAKDGTKMCLVARVTLADGTVLPNAPPQD